MNLTQLYNFFTTNMKKTLLLILGLVLTTSLFAGPVGKEEAKEKALAFLNGNVGTKDGVAKAPRHQQDLSLATTGDAYHVFNIGAGNGFVIVSGSDLTPDIIGYTDEGSFNPQSLPDNMKAWLQGYADQIEWVEKNGEPAASESVMRKAPADVKAPIAALIDTKWDQNAPYNGLVPSGCVTGCVATAMAQALYYCYQQGFSAETTKDIASYDDGNEHIVAACSATTFDWGNMELSYKGIDDATKKTAVAKLMKYCGASVGMMYGSSSSASTMHIAEALNTYFGFDHSLKNIYRNQFTTIEWENIIYQELVERRPVIYGGKSSGGGHAFICDGYDADGYFHINWGWGGSYNGYYLLAVVNPEKGGVGSGLSPDGYTMNQDAVIGIQTPTGNTTPEGAIVSCQQFDYTGTATVSKNQTGFQFDFTTHVKSELTFTHTFVFGVGVYDDEDHLVGTVHEYTSDFECPPSWASDISYRIYLNLKSLTAGKTYTLKQMSRLSSSSDWDVCYGSDAYYVQAVVDASNVTFTNVTPNYILTASDITLTTDGIVDTEQTVTAKIKNNSSDDYHGTIHLYKGSTKYASTGLDLEAGESTMVSFYFIPDVASTEYWTIKTDVGATIGSASITVKSGMTGTDDPTLTFSTVLNTVDDGGTLKFLGRKAKATVTATNSTGSNYEGKVTLVLWYDSYSQSLYTFKKVFVPAAGSTKIDFEYDLDPSKSYFAQVQYYKSGAATDGGNVTTSPCPVADVITTFTTDGTETKVLAKASYTVPAEATAVDLRGLSGIVTELKTEGANPNCLYIADFPAISGITKNWVNGIMAANVELTDGHDFYSPIDFTATKISYTREFSKGADGSGNGWSTIILPFAVDASAGGVKNGSTPIRWFTSSSDTDKDFWVYQFITDGKGTVKFDHAGNVMKANTPYLITMPSDHWGVEYKLTGTPITFEATDAVIKANEKNTQSGFYYMFTGGSQKQSVTDAYVLNDEGNKFKTTASGTVPAFQAYFYPSSHNLQADALAIGFVGHDEATGIVELTTDNGQESADDAWYTINGVKLTGEPTEKGVYIKGGRKYIIQ